MESLALLISKLWEGLLNRLNGKEFDKDRKSSFGISIYNKQLIKAYLY